MTLLEKELPEKEMLLQPIITAESLTQIYASRGVGKTFVAIGIAVALATNTSFLEWKAAKACKVVYIDGEMPASDMQKRFASAMLSVKCDYKPGNLGKL